MKTVNSALHLIGLLSDGGVHSHISTHLYALLELAQAAAVCARCAIHCFMDGRDVAARRPAADYVDSLQAKIDARSASAELLRLCGRYYAMDRDNRWERVEKAYSRHCRRRGRCRQPSACEAVAELPMKRSVTDEFVVPAVVHRGRDRIEHDDAIIFCQLPSRPRA